MPPQPTDSSPGRKWASFHQLTLELLRASPCLAKTLFRIATGRRGPRGTRLCCGDIEFPDWRLVPYRADLVRTFRDSVERTRHAAIYEVQFGRDPDKRISWPFYVAAAHIRWRCPVSLIVLTLNRSLARWCARPILLDTGGSVLRPQVVAPADIPEVVSVTKARDCPELAVLSAAAHGRGPNAVAIARAALLACATLDRHRGALYNDFIGAHLSESAFAAVREFMLLEGYEYQSDFARHYHRQGLEQGHEQGLEQGREQGLEQGLEQGRKALADLLVTLLAERFGALPPDIKQTIDGAATDTLLRWGNLMLSATSLDELLAS